MAQLYEGRWLDTATAAEEIGEDGRFRRIDSPLREWISPDPVAEFPAEAGRYHLYCAVACPCRFRRSPTRRLMATPCAMPIFRKVRSKRCRSMAASRPVACRMRR